MLTMRLGLLASSMACIMLAACTQAADEATTQQATALADSVPAFSPDPAARRALFGDLHLHSSYSLDAAAARTETTPDDAYVFAQGRPIDYLGQTIQRNVPLDFLAVTDHAEFLGNVRAAMAGEIVLPGDQENWQRLFNNDGGATMMELFGHVTAGLRGESRPGLQDPARSFNAWQDIIAAAERHYRPGEFTSLVGYEYSPTGSAGGGHMHRNVIFRGPNYPAMPFAATDSIHPEALWTYAETNRANGIESLMIPHNTNLSSGGAFAYEDTYGNPVDAEYARRRARNEPLVEITQNKGTSETLPALSPDDEFAGFELLAGQGDAEEARGSFVRSGLQRGMEMADRLGTNPIQMGFVGASDFHSGASSTEEDNFPGALGLSDAHRDVVQVLQELSPVLGSPLANLSAAGLTGVWAEVNTREAIFAALARRETFATSGPRLQLRMFAGWGEVGDWVERGDWAARAYRWGVPMGGELAGAAGRAPTLLVQAVKDPNSGNLDRIQIVKLWRENGQSFERIYDVAWSAGRSIGADGRLQPVGNTVDAATATYTNTIGATELFARWTDPDFDPSQRASYYARVLEIPTPRWATYLSAESGVPLAEGMPAWLQERAWSSPVWYQP